MKLSLNSELVSVRVDLSEGQILGIVKAALDFAMENTGTEAGVEDEVEEEIVVEGFAPSSVAGEPDAEPEEEPERAEMMQGIASQCAHSSRNDKEPCEPEDFGELLRAAEKKGKQEKAEEPKGYIGFLHMVCPVCAQEKDVSLKHPLKKFRCPEGHESVLTGEPRKAEYLCECGKYWRYKTNARSEIITVKCISCETPTDLMWNEKKQHYQKI